MAPINSKPNRSGITKIVHRKQHANREKSQDISDGADSGDEELGHNNSDMTASYTVKSRANHNAKVENLQDIADRVGKEVDVFAEALDQFKDKLHATDTQRDAALELCNIFGRHAADQVRQLHKQSQSSRIKSFKDSIARGTSTYHPGHSTTTTKHDDPATIIKELKRWQAEKETWSLASIIVQSRFPSDSRISQDQSALQSLDDDHQYASEKDTWSRWILNDEIARERQLIVQWLKECADEEIDRPVVGNKDRGTWSNGWMETRERIKGVKRMRMGDKETMDVRRSDDNDLLVSSLDPDAPFRQKRCLEKGDVAAERDLWTDCFDMLRKGRPWSEVMKYCAEHSQGWLSVSLGITGDEESCPNNTSGPAMGSLYRRMCLVAAKSGGMSDYEAATYGLLAGDLDTVKKVANSWNDHLFAYHNSVLLCQFDQFIMLSRDLQLPQDFVRRNSLSLKSTTHSKDAATASVRDVIRKLSENSTTSDEAKSAIKLIQASIIGNTLKDLFVGVGGALADNTIMDISSLVNNYYDNYPSGPLPETVIINDLDALRITTHLFIIISRIDREFAPRLGHFEYDNILGGYMEILRAAGKRDMTPLYGSLMTEEQQVEAMTRVLADDQDPRDKMDFIKLMQIYSIDAMDVINTQYQWRLDQVLDHAKSEKRPLDMLEDSQDELYPGKRIKLDGLDSSVSDDEEALINDLSVFYLVEAQWTMTFEALKNACGKLLVEGHFSAALTLTEQLQFEQLSLSKSKSIIGHSVNIMDNAHISSLNPSEATILKVRIMQKQSQAYFDMSLLTRAVSSLFTWRHVEHEYATKVPRPSSTPIKVKKALEELTINVEALFNGILTEDIVNNDHNTDGGKDDGKILFSAIRTKYLPEISIAYLTALTTASHMISKEECIKAMDLSCIISDPGDVGKQFLQAFTDSGRLAELVQVLAEISKVMLKLGEMGGRRRSAGRSISGGNHHGYNGRGYDVGIWELAST